MVLVMVVVDGDYDEKILLLVYQYNALKKMIEPSI